MRRAAIAIPIGLALALVSATSLAADQTVRATSSNTFTPANVTVNVGDTVTWTNDGGLHNVKFEDGKLEEPSSPSFTWTSNPKRTFDTPGSFRYFCEQHGSAGGVGMSGTVVVQGAGEPPPPGGDPPDTRPPDIDDLKIVPSTFCNRKTRTCKRTGSEIRFTIDEDAKVTGRIIRRKDNKRVGSLSITANAGEGEFAFSGKGLALGKYRLELTPKDARGNRPSKPSRANFTIATKRG
jgi:plastocyanin